MKKAFITGITGQDGSYLAEYLLWKGYEVHGLIRRSSGFYRNRIEHLYRDPDHENRLHLHYGDMGSPGGLHDLISRIHPDEVYNLAAQSHVRVSFDIPEHTADVVAFGNLRLLEALRQCVPNAKFYQASSSEMYGNASAPQCETTPFEPRSPYAVSKVFAFWSTCNYREAYRLFCSNGILFNHESPRRGRSFVTRKITSALAEIVAGTRRELILGNLEACRDWGFAGEYVELMWKILQLEVPGDYVIGSGVARSVRQFLDESFGYLGLDWTQYVTFDERYLRPTEVDYLLADISSAKRELGWSPKVDLRRLVRIMVDADLERLGLQSPGEGKAFLTEEFEWLQWENEIRSD